MGSPAIRPARSAGMANARPRVTGDTPAALYRSSSWSMRNGRTPAHAALRVRRTRHLGRHADARVFARRSPGPRLRQRDPHTPSRARSSLQPCRVRRWRRGSSYEVEHTCGPAAASLAASRRAPSLPQPPDRPSVKTRASSRRPSSWKMRCGRASASAARSSVPRPPRSTRHACRRRLAAAARRRSGATRHR